MNKTKKIVSSVLAGAMALSMMSISASADTCGHPSAVLRRIGAANVYYTSHFVPVITGSKVEQKECTIIHTIYNRAYICATCGATVSQASTDEDIRHSISHD